MRLKKGGMLFLLKKAETTKTSLCLYRLERGFLFKHNPPVFSNVIHNKVWIKTKFQETIYTRRKKK